MSTKSATVSSNLSSAKGSSGPNDFGMTPEQVALALGVKQGSVYGALTILQSLGLAEVAVKGKAKEQPQKESPKKGKPQPSAKKDDDHVAKLEAQVKDLKAQLGQLNGLNGQLAELSKLRQEMLEFKQQLGG